MLEYARERPPRDSVRHDFRFIAASPLFMNTREIAMIHMPGCVLVQSAGFIGPREYKPGAPTDKWPAGRGFRAFRLPMIAPRRWPICMCPVSVLFLKFRQTVGSIDVSHNIDSPTCMRHLLATKVLFSLYLTSV